MLEALKREEFLLLRRLVHQQTGIALADSKQALVEARLRPRLRALGLSSFLGYYRLLQEGSRGELQELVNAITTQTTAFFREAVHFEFVARELAPAWLRRWRQEGAGRLRCWSAACSTGEEAWSLASVLQAGLLDAERFDVRMLATDISTRALERAAVGRYPAAALGEVPAAFRGGFRFSGTGEHRYVEVSRELKAKVALRRLNLLAEPFPFHGRFDLILCRNVLIYFDEPTRARLVERLLRQLEPGGHLILGLSEALIRIPSGAVPLGQSIYRWAPEVGGAGLSLDRGFHGGREPDTRYYR